MILKIIINIIITLLQVIFGLVGMIAPDLTLTTYITDFLELINNTIQTSTNFIYFLIGDAMYPMLIFAIAMLGYKFLLFPVVVILRRIIIKGGDT